MEPVATHTDFLPAHHTSSGFRNPWMKKDEETSIGERLRWQWQRNISNPIKKPDRYDIPTVDPDSISLPEKFNSTALTWIGHSTYLIQIDTINILTDPVWSMRVGPQNFIGPKRLTPPAVPWDKLPRIDVVLISHSHFDHLDKPTVERLQADFDPLFIVPLGIKEILYEWGITMVEERDWWETVNVADLEFVCTPAQHNSRRGLFDANKTLWSGWLIIGNDETIYFAGDTGYFPEFPKIKNRSSRQIDVAILPIGAYKPRWYMRFMHLDPHDALVAFQELEARFFAGMHWGAFDGADERLDDPPRDLFQAADSLGVQKDLLWLFKLGETKIIPHRFIAAESNAIYSNGSP